MGNLAYPQLSTGAQVQYPIRRRRVIQSPLNAFSDGSMIASNLNANTQLVWELAYTELVQTDQAALQNLFTACRGPMLPFTFIDPTGNMLSQSAELTGTSWVKDPLLSITAGVADAAGGMGAFTLVNAGQTDQQIVQQVMAPASYQYCFSVYVQAPGATTVQLSRSSVSTVSEIFGVGASWTRLINTAQLSDSAASFSAGIVIPAGQSVTLFGPQLEAQARPSRYRATSSAGGVYQNAHFLGNSITFECDAPGLFSTLISIETT